MSRRFPWLSEPWSWGRAMPTGCSSSPSHCLRPAKIVGALETVERAIELNPLRPAYYCFFHALILWGNEELQEALEETEECLRKAPHFGGAELYRVIALVGLGRLDEAKARLAHYMARSGGKALVFPRPPELASRGLAALQTAGWRPSLVAHREAV